MAELATIARPYAEALFKAAGAQGEALKTQLVTLATLAGDGDLQAFAGNPKVAPLQVFDLIAGVALQKGLAFDARIVNLLRAVLDNGRLAALPAIAQQFGELVNAQSGVADAVIESAFPLSLVQVAETVTALEKRFGRKLNPTVREAPELIGGIRVSVGDEVLDTSVRARLEQMKAALSA